jgi:hypothetical protein
LLGWPDGRPADAGILTMKNLMRLISLLAVLLMAACSGGGGSTGACQFNCGSGGNPPPTTVDIADLDVQLAPGTIVNNGTATAIATITALDANRAAVKGVAITVSVDSGLVTLGAGTAGNAGNITDAAGKVLASVSLGSNLELRKITLTAQANSVKRSNTLQVVDSPTSAKPSTIELIATSSEVGTGGDGIVVRAFVKDANNNALPGAAVSFVTNTGTLSSVSKNTDPGGAGAATLSAGSDKANRLATVTVSSGAVTSTLKLPINGTKLTLSGPSSLILGNTSPFDVVVLDSKSNPVPNIAVAATSSLGNALTPGSASTDSNGKVRFFYAATKPGTDGLLFASAGTSVAPVPPLLVSGQDFSFVAPAASTKVPVKAAQVLTVLYRNGGVPQVGAIINFAATGGTLSSSTATTNSAGQASVSLISASAGPITVQATVAGGGASPTITTLPLLVIATVPSKLILQITPTALAPNLGTSTANQAQAVAKVTDADSNPVQGQVVNFSRVADPSGGTLLQASATTDASGQATVAYQSGAESTANNGVVLKATVADSPTVSGQTTLTVNQSALFIALGTGNEVSNADPQTYKKDYVVYVTDSNGIAVNGVTLTLKAIPTDYITGQLRWNGVVWDYDRTATAVPPYRCRSEDLNGNGILDIGEDDNGDGVLWPGNVIAVSPSNVQTNGGRATISLAYAESYVPWVQLRLTASATVSGTESKTDSTFVVRGVFEDFSSETRPPAAVSSPFGSRPKSQALINNGICTLLLP